MVRFRALQGLGFGKLKTGAPHPLMAPPDVGPGMGAFLHKWFILWQVIAVPPAGPSHRCIGQRLQFCPRSSVSDKLHAVDAGGADVTFVGW
eukprot:9169775-Pyramimonas_sp.AAC.1